MKTRNITRILQTVAFLLFFGCAQIKPPPGGPEDKSPPKVNKVVPADSSVNVPVDSPIEITFDEYIEGFPGNVALSPPVDEFEVKFRHKGIEINHSLLKTNTTYRVVVSTALSDLRGNSLRSALSYAFSTGPKLDTLEITGQVYDTVFAPASGIRVHGFSSNRSDIDPRDTKPDAISWSGNNGKFTLANLPDGEFSIMAFRDDNRDGLLSPNELLALSPRDIKAGSDIEWSMVLFAPDSMPPELISSSVEREYLVRFQLSEPVNIEGLQLFSNPNIGEFEPFIYPDNPKNMGIFTENPLPKGKIDLELTGISDFRGNSRKLADELRIEQIEVDTTEPTLKMDKGLQLYSTEPLVVRFDRPIRNATIVVKDSMERAIEGKTYLPNPFTIVFDPSGIWQKREDIVWRPEEIVTPEGDTIVDTTYRELRFHAADDYGKLEVRIAPPCDNLIVRALQLDEDKHEYTLQPRGNIFIRDNLPVGDYSIYLFCDKDSDSLWFPGDISPLKAPEPIFIYPDTVIIRGFWTTEVDIGIK